MLRIPTQCPWGRQKVDLRGVTLTVEQKLWLVGQINSGKISARALAIKYNLNEKTVQKYAWKFNNHKPLQETGGRARLISPEEEERLREKLESSQYGIRSEDFDEMVKEAAAATRTERYGIAGDTEGVSRTSVKRLEKKMGVQSVNVEQITDARALATADLHNSISFAAMNYYMVQTRAVSPLLIINADATQFTVGGSGVGNVKIKYVKTKGKRPEKTREKKGEKGLTKYFIKYYMIVNATGLQADPIYMLADENMGDEELRVYEVPGLGVGTQVSNKGYVVITKTRCANAQFYEWMNGRVLIPFVESIRSVYEEEMDNTEAWFQLDGEAKQLEIFKDPAILKELRDASVTVGKPPASTTATTQPLDAGNCFKGPKTASKKINNKDVRGNKFMLNRLTKLFQQHNEWLNSEERGELRKKGKRRKTRLRKSSKVAPIEMNPSHVQMAKPGLLRVQMALQHSMKQHMIRESFEITGIYPFSLNVILSKCKSTISEEEKVTIAERLPQLAARIGEFGELFEADLQAVGVDDHVDREGKKSIDDLVLNRRRAVILTHPRLHEREDIVVEVPEEKPTRKRKARVLMDL